VLAPSQPVVFSWLYGSYNANFSNAAWDGAGRVEQILEPTSIAFDGVMVMAKAV